MSQKKFTKPSPDYDPEDSLHRDILVCAMINDILEKKDPQIDRLKQIIFDRFK